MMNKNAAMCCVRTRLGAIAPRGPARPAGSGPRLAPLTPAAASGAWAVRVTAACSFRVTVTGLLGTPIQV